MIASLIETAKSATHPVMILDADRNLVFANQLLSELLDYSSDELSGQPVGEKIMHPSADPEDARRLCEGFKGNTPFDYQLLCARKDGTPHLTGGYVFPVLNGLESKHFVAIKRSLDDDENVMNCQEFRRSISAVMRTFEQHS